MLNNIIIFLLIIIKALCLYGTIYLLYRNNLKRILYLEDELLRKSVRDFERDIEIINLKNTKG